MVQSTDSLQVRRSIGSYYRLTKPNIWYLLVFTAMGAMIAAGGLNISLRIATLVIVSVSFGSAAANTLTSYIDRDMDAIMERTKNRPIPSGEITPTRAFWFGLGLALLSIIMALAIHPLAAGLMMFGLFDNVVVYSVLLKRRSSWNIILGGFSGGAPALIGYTAVTGAITLEGILIASLVFVWIPAHIWSLSLRYKDDYSKVNVPMLPVVISLPNAIRVIALSSILLVVFSIALYFIGSFGLAYLATAVISGTFVLIKSVQLVAKPSEENAWNLFKISNPYLAILFVAMMIEAVI